MVKVRNITGLLIAIFAACTIFSSLSYGGEKTDTNDDFYVSNFDFMYFADGKFNFYRLSDGKAITYEAEKGKIINYRFAPNSMVLYYCVCEGKKLILKSIDFSQHNPKPVKVVDLGLKIDDCISETYGEYGALVIKNDGSAIGIQHNFNWDVYGFDKVKIYYPNTGKLKDNGDWSIFFEGNPSVNYSDFEYRQDEDSDIGPYKLYYVNNGANVCLSDKIDFDSMTQFEKEREEFEPYQYSPNGKYILYGAILEWGDYPHGPYCIASLNGKYQLALEDTDISQTSAVNWLDNGALIYVGTDQQHNQCIKIVWPEKDKQPNVLIPNASDFLIMNVK